jgi:O-antigen/teichoic acid export membrane protein
MARCRLYTTRMMMSVDERNLAPAAKSSRWAARFTTLDAPDALARRFGTGVLWSTLATVFNQGSTLLANIVIARLLERARFGEFALVLSTTQALVSLGGLGMGYTATKFLAELRGRQHARAERILGLCQTLAYGGAAFVAAALLVFAPALSIKVTGDLHLAALLRLGAVTVFFVAVNGYMMGALAGLEQYRSLGAAGVLSGTVYFLACFFGTLKWGLLGAVAGLCISAAGQWLVLFLSLSRGTWDSRRNGP